MPAMERQDLTALARDALAHLYDLPHLGRSVLASELAADTPDEVRGQRLHRLLLEAIEALRPPARVPMTANAWRPYLALSLRYAEEKTTEQAAQEIGVSLRQLRREHARGLENLADVLWEQRASPAASPPPTLSVLEREVARLSGARTETMTSLNATVQSVFETLQRIAQARGVAIHAVLAANDLALPIERTSLRQILLNVLSHAIESPGAQVVHLSARRGSASVEVVVRRAAASPGPHSQAARDGRLAVAEQLAAAQGGQVSINEDADLTIRLLLPLHGVTTVLVIDDNPEMIQLFRRYLAGGAYEVVSATSGEEGLRLAEQSTPAAIVLDVMMPNQDGWEVLQNLKNLPATRHIPVVVCSVLKEQELAHSLGAHIFLAKPVSQQMLVTALDQCVASATPTRHPASP